MEQGRPLQGIDNFRDFGGFAVGGGRMVRRGRLLRSAHPANATDHDLAVLAAIPVPVVVDLRRRAERRQAPSPRNALFSPLTIQNDEGDGEAPHVAFLRGGDLSAAAVEAYLTGYYRNAFFEPRHRDLFARTFAVLADQDGAVLIHCTAGKDRTGLLAALIRTTLGGGWAETAADFVETNRHTLTPERRAAAMPGLTAMIGAPPSEAIQRAFLGVWPHHLDIAFAEIEARCGSLDAYLVSLGVDEGARRRLAQQLVV